MLKFIHVHDNRSRISSHNEHSILLSSVKRSKYALKHFCFHTAKNDVSIINPGDSILPEDSTGKDQNRSDLPLENIGKRAI